ncbi:MAG: site-2 protease family protein [Vicinamibacterales bacterium]
MHTYADNGMPWQLAPGIELFAPTPGVIMAYIPTTRRYVRLSPVAADFVARLQRADAEPMPSADAALSARVAAVAVPPLVPALTRVGILRPAGDVTRSVRGHWPVLRLPLWRPNRVLLPPLGVALCDRYAASLLPLATLLIATALAAIGAVWWRDGTPGHAPASWSALAGLTALHVVLHEAAHGLTAGRYGVPIREFGVGLLYWCLPVAYTDRTDAYRLPNARAHAAIAAAGPIFDIGAMGVTAACVLAGGAGATGRALLTAQLAIALANLNPLLPGDAYHLAVSLLGRLQARRDAFTLLIHLLRHGRAPARMAQLTRRQRCGYVVYAVASVLYVVAVVTLPALLLHFRRSDQ